MNGRKRRTQRQLVVIVLALLAMSLMGLAGWLQAPGQTSPATAPAPGPAPAPQPAPAPRPAPTPRPTQATIVPAQIIRNEAGRVIFRGNVDLAPTLARIAAGERDAHETDGDYFRNYEQRLPIKRDRNHYRKYVVRTPGYQGTGPQRLIVGADGEMYYTPDHYETFRRVYPPARN